jgi:hypothetical protein
MANSSTHIRHGLYLPIELLDQLRLLAQRKHKSINKQIEEIIRDWFTLKNEKKTISRKEFLSLPIERRHEQLRNQASKMVCHYTESKEFEGGQGDLFEYD